jgi:hypothetical protein
MEVLTSGLIQGWWRWFGPFLEWILSGLKEHTEVPVGLWFMVCAETTFLWREPDSTG